MIDVNDERVMTRLLVGNLAPGEREFIEERLAADPAYFEAVCALEDEMVLEWHRGSLSDEQRQMFARAYLASPARRERVAAGRRLIDTIDDWTHAQEEARCFWWTRMRRYVATPRQVLQFSLAATAVLLVALPIAIYEMGGAVRRLQHISVIFPLPPVTERGGDPGQRTNVLRIPRDADEVRLQFEIADPGDATGLDAILETLERTPNATPTASAGATAVKHPVRLERTARVVLVTLTVAAGDLLDGDYVLKLRRTQADGRPGIVATRTFRVMRE